MSTPSAHVQRSSRLSLDNSRLSLDMFKSRKRKGKPKNLRNSSRNDDEDDTDTANLLQDAKKRLKGETSNSEAVAASALPIYETKEENKSSKDLATSTAHHLPKETLEKTEEATAERGKDGIFRDKTRNKFHAGPVRAAGNIRVTARFDYDPSICKDYKETGFCGFGDTCIYLHDRGDTLAGWQLEKQWEEQQRKKKEAQEKEISKFVSSMGPQADGDASDGGDAVTTKDGIPFACYTCREYFKNPVVTICDHYFCEACIMQHVRSVGDACPICQKDTGSMFNQPTRLEAKKRRILGSSRSQLENSWQEYAIAFQSMQQKDS